MPAANTIPAIMGRLVLPENGCLLWPGQTRLGSGRVAFEGRKHSVHVLMYQCCVGPIPEGHDLDHLCRNPACAHVCHLEPVLHHENVLRGQLGAKQREQTHCKSGHALSGAHLIIDRRGWRACRECGRLRKKKFRLAHPREPVARVHQHQTHCPQGHASAGENLSIDRSGVYHCRICRAAVARRFRELHS